MRKLLAPQENKILDEFPHLFFGLYSFSILLPTRINVGLIILLSLFFLIYILVNKITIDWRVKKSPLIILILVLLVVQVIGLTHSPDRSSGWKDIERYGAAVLFVAIFLFAQNLKLTVSFIIATFGVGCALASLYGFGFAFFLADDLTRENIFQFGHTYFTDLIKIHPTYLSIYFLLVFFFLLETLRIKYNQFKFIQKILIALGLLGIIGMLLFIRSQMELIIFVLLCVLYVIITFKRRAWFVAFPLFAIALVIFLLDKSRVTIFFDTYGKNVSTAIDNRLNVWEGAIEAIKASPIFGAGTGGEELALNDSYLKIGFQEGIDKSYNAHNQYLEFWVRNGIIELCVFFTLLIYSFRQSLKSFNYTFLMFNMIFSLSMLTESCLNVHRGIVFFYFFLSAFILLPYSLQDVNERVVPL